MADEHDTDVPALDAPVESGPVSHDETTDDGPIYRRQRSESTRKLFAEAAGSLKKQLEDGAGDDEVPAIANEPPAAAATAVAAPPASQAEGSAAAAAPALDSRAALQLEVREKSIADREAKLAEREKSLEPYTALRDKYLDNGAATLRDLIKDWTGASTDDELKDEVADLISDLSSNVLGLSVSNEIKTRLDSRRAIKQVKSYKADLAKREAELTKKADADQQQQRERAAVQALADKFRATEVATKYPHLLAEDAPHEIVWDVIKTKAEREPDWKPNWEEAAKLANDHFKATHEAQHKKLQRLFTPATTTPAVEATHQGAPQSRGARTLTNASTAPIAPQEPVDDDEPYNREKSRRRSLDKLRAKMQERQT